MENFMNTLSGGDHKGGNVLLHPVHRPSFFIFLVLCLLAACAPARPNTTSFSTPPISTDPIPISGFGAPCSVPAQPTVELTEGPYFKSGSPERTSLLEDGMPGTPIVLSGYVFTPDCNPVAGALLDFWQADADGQYDNTGYRLRGHQFTDAAGYYQLTTIVPGLYPGRTEHIHIKVQAPDGPTLTTQLFFPDVFQNRSDDIFDASLVVRIQDSSSGLAAAFNFIVNP
jgi:hypothetical protein